MSDDSEIDDETRALCVALSREMASTTWTWSGPSLPGDCVGETRTYEMVRRSDGIWTAVRVEAKPTLK